MALGDTPEDGLERALGASPTQVRVSRARHVLAAPEEVFAALADPGALAGLLPRVRKVELLEQGDSWARIVTHMQVTPLIAVRAEGAVRWRAAREVVFSTARPVGVETRIELRPTPSGTNVYVTLALDLAPMIGPLAALVPAGQVAAAVAPDLDATLEAIARAAEQR